MRAEYQSIPLPIHEGGNDVSLIEPSITGPVAFTPRRGLARQVLRGLQHLNNVQVIKDAVVIRIARQPLEKGDRTRRRRFPQSN